MRDAYCRQASSGVFAPRGLKWAVARRTFRAEGGSAFPKATSLHSTLPFGAHIMCNSTFAEVAPGGASYVPAISTQPSLAFVVSHGYSGSAVATTPTEKFVTTPPRRGTSLPDESFQ